MPNPDKPDNPQYPFKYGEEIKFIGGKYNGFLGVVLWNGETVAQVQIKLDGQPFEVIEETKFMQSHKP